ncbi:hypothetical protein PILCRDRAFT_90510 [Piloderma croceum F 1598]|uniref:Uncharacterized protein n=1 Tax=Piloderma croceum (strain F 1598) TaxID=765440 RepID=A0A0C3F1W0_PILCF|nr:hypothetical protein PILCRDRAFT_90510 [Piloderma croceum F 1598]
MTGVTADLEAMHLLSEKAQNLVEECVKGNISTPDFLNMLKEGSLRPSEAKDYIDQLNQQCLQVHRDGERDPGWGEDDPIIQASTPEGLEGNGLTDYRAHWTAALDVVHQQEEEAHRKVLDSAEWSMLAAKIASIRLLPSFSPLDLYQLFDIPSLSLHTPLKLSTGLLAAAPHLAKSPGSASDPHLDKTWTLCCAFALEVTQIIDKMQTRSHVTPLVCSIWRLVVLNQYVDFEKLFTSMDPGYNHNDELKEFYSEADWLCIFSAWESGVCELYPHHSDVTAYHHFTNDLFQANPADPDIFIHFNQHVHLCYKKNPFQLNDCTLTQVSLYASLVKTASKCGDHSI